MGSPVLVHTPRPVPAAACATAPPPRPLPEGARPLPILT
jgi:hypothetical protein